MEVHLRALAYDESDVGMFGSSKAETEDIFIHLGSKCIALPPS